MSPRLPHEETSAVLAHLCRTEVPPLEALQRLNAHLTGTSGDFRSSDLHGDGRKLCPAPAFIPELLALLFHRLTEALNGSAGLADDLTSAAFAFHGLTAIRPFPAGNGRTALAFAQYLLMMRHARSAPLLALPEGAHRLLEQLLGRNDAAPAATGPDAQADMTVRLRQQFEPGSVEREHHAARLAGVAELFTTVLVDAPRASDLESLDLASLRSR